MKTYEYRRIHGLATDDDWRKHFRYNMMTGRLPVALYSCLYCNEILWDGKSENHSCYRKALPVPTAHEANMAQP